MLDLQLMKLVPRTVAHGALTIVCLWRLLVLLPLKNNVARLKNVLNLKLMKLVSGTVANGAITTSV